MGYDVVSKDLPSSRWNKASCFIEAQLTKGSGDEVQATLAEVFSSTGIWVSLETELM